MKRPFRSIAVFAAVFAAAAAAPATTVASPFAICSILEARLAAGEGVTLPDADRALVRFAGTIDVAEGGWPAEFLAREGQTICVAVSPVTGCYEFFDESGAVFWTVVPVLPTTDNWVAPFRHAEEGTFPDDDLYAPWRLVDVWLLSNAEAAELESGAEAAENAELDLNLEFVDNCGQLRFVNNPREGLAPATNLCITAFSFTETNLFFTAAWPTNEPLPDATLDLYGLTNLLDSSWIPLSSHPATTNPVSFSVERDALPWHVAPTQHVHGVTCESITNIVASPLDGTTVYTNVFWSCSTNRMPGDAGFFRLGTRHDTDGDGLFDAAELLVFGTRPDRLDSDGDGVPDGIAPSVWWGNPLWATNYDDVDFIVDIVAPTDGSAETILSMDGTRIPLSPAAGSWYFSLPPGEAVSCSVETTGSFYVLWAGTLGGSFWNDPDSFETSFWTSGNMAGYHEGGGSYDIAVPVLTVEPDFGGGLRSGGSPNGSHVGQDGSVCVHAADGIQRFSWTLAPAVAAVGRTPATTGAVQLDSGNPFIDVSAASGVLSGTFGFGPGWAPGGGIVWGWITNALSAHRCDATPTSPYCSICGCYEPLDVALDVSKTLLTLKHDNQTTLAIVHPYSWGENFSEGAVEIRRAGEANEWLSLGTESDLDPWTARIAGHFELRGIVSVDGRSVTTAVQQVEVQFPSIEQIAADPIVIDAADEAWTSNKLACTRIPNLRREHGFAIRLDTTNNLYVCDTIAEGSLTRPWEDGEIFVPVDPYNNPAELSPIDSGAVYYVADFHAHTSPVYLEGWIDFKPVGVSSNDLSVARIRGVPGIVLDYVADPNLTNAIPAGHPLDAPAQFYFTTPPQRRHTPNPPAIP